MCDGAWRDMQYGSEYWRQFEGPIAQVSTSVNDAYLKANDQQHGVQSYGLVVDLLIAYYRG